MIKLGREVKCCTIEWNDDKSQEEVLIALSCDTLEDDDEIFYYMNHLRELEESVGNPSSTMDFTVIEILED